MVNTQLLEEAIDNSGKTRKHLANAIGKTVQTLRLKITGRLEFTNTETDILCRELSIRNLTEKERIFFAKNVEK